MKIINYSKIYAGLLVCSALMLGSCVKDKLYNTPHPDKGAVMVSTDWTGLSSESIKPTEYVLRIGDEEQTVSTDVNTFKSLFVPSTQHLLVYHHANNITISGTTATVNTVQNGSLNPMPGYLFSSYKEIQIPKDDTLQVVMPMKQLIRQLVLNLKLNEGDEHIIVGTSATLTGIAPSVDLTTGEINAAAGRNINPVFEITTIAQKSRAVGTPALAATMQLFGVMVAEKQELSIAFTLTNGTTQTVTSDITDALKNFSVGTMDPLILNATLKLPPKVGINATITDWKIVDNGDINVN